MVLIKKYVPSIYNLFYPYDHGDYQWIIANTFSGAIISADGELKKFLSAFDSDRCDSLLAEHFEVHDYLRLHNFLVETDLNELERVKIRFQQAKYNERSMHLTILPTIDCNLACVYCYENNQDKSMTPEITDKVKDFVTSRIDYLTSLGVTWYGGEPLLQAAVIEELSRYFTTVCDEKQVKYSASMITNGTLLTPDTVDLLVRGRVGRLQVTVDGPEEIHNGRRFYKNGPRESFQDIIKGLEACRGKLPVNIRINVDRTNIKRFKDLIDYFHECGLLGIDSKNGVSLGLVKEWTKQVKIINKEILSLQEFEGCLEELSQYLKKRGISAGNNYVFNPQTPCGAVNINNFLVAPDGKLHKCWIHSTENDEEVGNLNYGLDLSGAAAVRWTAYDPTLDAVCAACSYLPFCAGGCPYEMVNKLVDKEDHCRHTYQFVRDNVIRAVKNKVNKGG